METKNIDSIVRDYFEREVGVSDNNKQDKNKDYLGG